MIKIRKSEERGHANHGWLDSYHTFSFSTYQDPAFMGFKNLRVLNQDRVAPGEGFGTHGHKNMEIVTYVIDGTLEHQDNMGNKSQIRAGEVQVMSAGSGVTHSEYNASTSEQVHFLQMWVLPREQDSTPRYQQALFPTQSRQGKLCLIASPNQAESSLRIEQDAYLYAGLLNGNEHIDHKLSNKSAWLHLAKGELQVNGLCLSAGDGLSLVEEDLIHLSGKKAEFVMWEFTPE